MSGEMRGTRWEGLNKRYAAFLPVSEATPIVSLSEGNTPLIYAAAVSECVGKGISVFLKYEGLNPTGSFKDRGMTMAISKAKEAGARAVMCASTGNTSASAAAYCARAGLTCIVLIPKGAIALGKLAQALIHGAKVLAVDGNFDQALELVRTITDKYPVTLVNSINPYRIEGQKTAAFEICDFFGEAPEFLAIPVGNAGNITAYWRGFNEYKQKNKIGVLPKMLGFQAEGAAPIVRKEVVKNPKTIATAIKIGNPASWRYAEAARDESGGIIDMVSDDEILAAYALLAGKEGVFVEPASAASVAGILKLAKQGYFKDISRAKIVCVVTGHGLKDPDRAIQSIQEPVVIPPTVEAVLDRAGIGQ
ncbi:MAG: threonine synthase [Candidatus Omnitrophica bacterium]|nr:threonine synthase [Candidatus Omnitrophota bacterium]